MAKKIKLTDTMAAAMLDTRHVGQGDISWGGMGYSTCKGLRDRGLVESRLLRNGDAPGYAGRYPDVENWHAFLTPAGRIVQADLRADADRRTWTEEELTPAPQPCGSWSPTEPVQTCKREAGHAGLCRPTVSYVSTQQHWNMDAGRLTLEEAQEEAQTAGLMGELSVVRIAYADGTTEECRNIPSGEIAAGIFAEAVSNDRVVKAELVRGDGTVAAQYPSEPMPRARPVVGLCGRHMSESVARAYGWKSLAACARVPGHPGRHRDTRGIAPLTMHWGANETAPLDPTP